MCRLVWELYTDTLQAGYHFLYSLIFIIAQINCILHPKSNIGFSLKHTNTPCFHGVSTFIPQP